MAIDIASGLRLDLVGIDFLTKDIACSWKEGGAVIEANAYPGVGATRAEAILREKFKGQGDGRIPTTLMVGGVVDGIDAAFRDKAKASNGLGYTSSKVTMLDGNERSLAGRSLYQRCLALLISRDCEDLTVAMHVAELANGGLPLDWFDRCVIRRDVTNHDSGKPLFARRGEVFDLLAQHCGDIELQEADEAV